MFRYAIARRPGQSMINGITQTPELGKVDIDLALKQYDQYLEALDYCGLDVTLLEPNEEFPDSCFVEDTALCTPNGVIISRPGAESRRGESQLPDLQAAIRKHYDEDKIRSIVEPGLVEPGDIVMADGHFFIGISKRTNQAGADQVIKYLEEFGLTGETIEVVNLLHLKGDMTYLDNNTMVVSEYYKDRAELSNYKKIVVPADEAYAANTLWINGKVLLPEGYPKMASLIREAGYEVVTVGMSEFMKITGSLTCLSLRFQLVARGY